MSALDWLADREGLFSDEVERFCAWLEENRIDKPEDMDRESLHEWYRDWKREGN